MAALIYVWIALTVVSAVVEAIAKRVVSIWFIPGAIIAMVMAFLGIAEWIQITVFAVVSVLCVLLFRLVLVKRGGVGSSQNSPEDIVGQKCIVCARIENAAGGGHVEVNGQTWSARSADTDITFEIGEELTVIAVEGVKLICR